jgi:UDP-2,3-diacylglucosamine hydrolase
MSSTIFFADTHLNVSRPDKTKRVINFLNSFTSETIFYILGDFFDLWIGSKHLELIDYQDILEELRHLTSMGCQINLIPGNRDFQIGKHLTLKTGVKVLPELFGLTLQDKKILLTHGDIFCAEDRGYQTYRRLSRTKIVKSVFQSFPMEVGKKIASGIRNYSEEIVPQKLFIYHNIVDSQVRRYFKKNYDIIICGHIHKQTRKEILPGKTLITLGNWDKKGSYLEYRDGEFIFSECS